MATGVSYGAMPFPEQIAFFRRKLNLGTTSYADIYGAEHDWAFVVAGANRDDLLTDFRQAVDAVISQGGTLEQFRQDFDRIVATHGWDYNGSRNWRSKVIYDANLRSSYAAGRYQQLQAVKERRPWWRYNHSDAVEHPRPLHLEWDGTVLHADDPWWETHFGPNGWGCQCWVSAHNDRDLARMGKKGPDTAPPIKWVDQVIGKNSATGPRTVRVPEGVDPGWAYTPGRGRLQSAIPRERPDDAGPSSSSGPGVPNRRPSDPLPPPRRFNAEQLLPAGGTPEYYVENYLQEFGATLDRPAIVQDVVGERLVVGADLFRDVTNGEWKVLKRGRERYLPLLAQALLDPDEIWVRIEWLARAARAVVRRRYLARFQIQGESTPALAVFEVGADGWAGVTTFQANDGAYLEAMRLGVRLYRRDGE
ncbi:PBECR2 nuclease fold domain-containing protein [Pigmentiphaga kullae]|uniref:Phage Mu protein F like protein n=1 Tax=Pigmentiphaga kullae TaxID=151784 RepID=A0A4Q7NM30_9BURK|nr:PBECR2 nuclease fold domain-containing protein [Pigmentiphaga kullae]RZS86062.1 phage Mu protein F like protein [Pigmentiphaga kullae]